MRPERRGHRKSYSSSAISSMADQPPPPRSRDRTSSLPHVDPLQSATSLLTVLDVVSFRVVPVADSSSEVYAARAEGVSTPCGSSKRRSSLLTLDKACRSRISSSSIVSSSTLG